MRKPLKRAKEKCLSAVNSINNAQSISAYTCQNRVLQRDDADSSFNQKHH